MPRKIHWLSAPTILVLTAGLRAEEPLTNCPVAVVDMEYLFVHSEELQQSLQPLADEAVEIDREITERRETVDELRKELGNLSVGSTEHAVLLGRILRKEADWKILRDKSHASLIRRESAIYHRFFEELDAEIDKLMRERNIMIVVRSDGKRHGGFASCGNCSSSESTWKEHFRPSFRAVIRYDSRVDITKAIHDRLAEKHRHDATAGDIKWPWDKE